MVQAKDYFFLEIVKKPLRGFSFTIRSSGRSHGVTFFILLNLSEEVNSLSLAAAQSYVSLVQVICDAL